MNPLRSISNQSYLLLTLFVFGRTHVFDDVVSAPFQFSRVRIVFSSTPRALLSSPVVRFSYVLLLLRLRADRYFTHILGQRVVISAPDVSEPSHQPVLSHFPGHVRNPRKLLLTCFQSITPHSRVNGNHIDFILYSCFLSVFCVV